MKPDFSTHGYGVTQELGRNYEGGRITYLASNINSNQLVVIKEFRFAQQGADWAGYSAHEREIQVLRRLQHSRIPRYLDAFETENGFCLVQEYKQAKSLAEKSQFNPEEIKKIAISVLEILEYLQGLNPSVLHRDIKPENILIDDDLNAYLIDFGCARIETGNRGLSSFVAGTLGFMPHEQINNQPLKKASDLYSLGATLICLLTKTRSQDIGQLISPRKGFNFKGKVPHLHLHRDFITWLEKMVDPEMQKRHTDAKSALRQLKSIRVEGLSLSEKVGNVVKNTVGFCLNKYVIIPLVIVVGAGVWGINHSRDVEHQKMIAEQAEQKAMIAKKEAEKKAVIAKKEEQKQKQRDSTAQKLKLQVTKKCVKCDLQKVDLSDASLEGDNLQGANLGGAYLKDSKLNNANLQGATLQEAKFGSDSSDSSLEGANLTNANLKGTNLMYVDLNKANLQGTNLQDANLSYADLTGADLTNANLQDANLDKIYGFDKANLTNATMPDGKKYEEWKK